MKHLQDYFNDIFNDYRGSNNRIAMFAQIHLIRLNVKNTSGHYDAMVLQTQPLYEAYRVALDNVASSFSRQQGRTVNRNKQLTAFKTAAVQKAGLVRGTWGRRAPEYQEFFPYGLKEYHLITLLTADVLMERLVQAFTKHESVLGTDNKLLFEQLYADFKAVQKEQSLRKGLTGTLRSNANTAKKALTQQLTANLLRIAADHIDQPDMMDDFFDTTILHKRKANKKKA